MLAALALGMMCGKANADFIAWYSFDGNTTSPVLMVTGLTGSNVTTINHSTISYVPAIDTTSVTPAISTTDFYTGAGGSVTNNGFTFTLTVAPNASLDLTGLSFFGRAFAAGPSTTTVLMNGNTLGSFSNTAAFVKDTIPLSLTGLTGTLTFQFIGGGISESIANGGSTQASNTGSMAVDDFLFTGTVNTVTAVPEPAAVGILGAGAALLLVSRRRRTKA
jgi:hypothetical protein